MENQIQKKTYPGLDVGKFLCAFLILFYHYFSEHGGLPGILDEVLSLYAVAVALFMTISGFLLFNKLESVQGTESRWPIVKRQIVRIYTIYLIWSIPYLAFSISRWDWSSISWSFVLWQIQGWVFKSTFYTIWFMPMLAIGIFVTFWFTEKLPAVAVNILAVVCYGIGALLMTYKFVGTQIPGFLMFANFADTWIGGARGWMFFAFPLIMVGRLAVKNRHRFKPLMMFGLTIICLALLLVEALVLRKVSGGHTGIDLTVMMVPTVYFACGFLICVPIPSGKYCIWMRNMSTLIFMSQRLFLTVLPSIIPTLFFKIYSDYTYGGAVLIIVCEMLCGASIINASKKHSGLKKLY